MSGPAVFPVASNHPPRTNNRPVIIEWGGSIVALEMYLVGVSRYRNINFTNLSACSGHHRKFIKVMINTVLAVWKNSSGSVILSKLHQSVS